MREHCSGCGAEKDTPHEDGCGVARCLWTGMQRIQCDGYFSRHAHALMESGHHDLAKDLAESLGFELDHDCGEDIWTGEWPGVKDAEELGWFSYFGPEHTGERGWVRCSPDDPRGSADLNRLAVDAEWDRDKKKWVAP